MPVKNKIVQIDLKPENLGRRAKLDLGLCGDIKDTIRFLLPLVEKKEIPNSSSNNWNFTRGQKEITVLYSGSRKIKCYSS